MKNFYTYIWVAALLITGLGAASHALAIDYAPLEPLPGLENVQNLNFAQFLGTIFKLLLTAGALLSVGVLVYAGIMYMISGAGAEMGEAKNRIKAALFGMLILLGAWLMLYTVNPALLNFDLTVPGSTGGGQSTQEGKTDINITAEAVLFICPSNPPSAERFNAFANTCKNMGKNSKKDRTIDKGNELCAVYACK